MNNSLEKDLKDILGERVTTSEFERWFYSSDVMNIPRAIKALFDTMPSAVAKPESADQVVAIARYCQDHGIPITPRGAGSSGLLAAVPKRGGIVVDTRDLSKVIDVDEAQETVTAEAGITLWQLEKTVNKRGLALKSYPSSARSATVGGWMMTSGLGIGSLKYGPVFDHILSAELVLADGSVKEYVSGEGLERFFESEGMLGIVTKITLRVRQIPEMLSHHLVYFEMIDSLFQAVTSVVNSEPCPYSLEVFDHRYLALLKNSGYEVGNFGPGSGALLVTYDGSEEEVSSGRSLIDEVTHSYSGVQWKGAEREWQQRFNMLRVKRAVPSLLVSSVYVPLKNLEEFYSRFGRIGKRATALAGHVVSRSECNLMPLVATDERRTLEHLFALLTPRDVSDLALSFGGKPGGGVGVWNAPYKAQILGKTRMAEIEAIRNEFDKKKIMNPGMWPDPPLLFKPRAYQLTTNVVSRLERVVPTNIGSLQSEEYKKEITNCVQCGYCMDSCPTRGTWLSSTPRGRILMTKQILEHPLSSRGMNLEYLNRVYNCTLCGRCRTDCSVNIKSRPMWLGVREYLSKNGLESEQLRSLTEALEEMHNIATKPNDQRSRWVSRLELPYDLRAKKTADVVYFVGCVASFYPMAQPAARAFTQIMEAAAIDFTILGGEEWCCGFPLMAAGQTELAAKFIRHNLERIEAIGAKKIVMTCPGCYRVWKEEYSNLIGKSHRFDVFHATEFLADLLDKGKLCLQGMERSITYHDPCDLGRNSGIFDQPRHIMEKIPGLSLVELEENREYCSCCGAGGDLLASNQELALDISKRKLAEILSIGVETVVTACPSCVRLINMTNTAEKAKLEVLDITELLWKGMGK